MHYRALMEIGNSYRLEVGSSGHRTSPRVWEGIQNKLKAAILDLKNNTSKAAAVALASNSMADRRRFFVAAAAANFVDKLAEVKRAHLAEEARKRVAFCRQWLALEGASANADGNVVMGPMGALKVYYDDDAHKQDLTKVYLLSGRIYNDSGGTVPLSTKEMVTHFSGPGKAIYVMSAAGNIHIASHIVGHYHHSSLLNGQPVACAGEIELMDGYVKWLSNKSGHYFPNPAHLVQVLHQLQKKGVAMTFPLKVITATGATKEFKTVGDFLADRQLNDEPDYELMKLFAYSAYLDDSILALNNWRWRIGATEDVGVYDKTSNLRVPHKTVRAWFKTHGYLATEEIQSGVRR